MAAGITFNGVQYPIRGDVVKRRRTQWGDALRMTAEQLPSDRSVPSWIQEDWSGGVGLQKMTWAKAEHRIRFEDAEAETRFPGQITPPLLIQTPTGPEEEISGDRQSFFSFIDFKGKLCGLVRYYDTSEVDWDVYIYVFDPDHGSTQWDNWDDIELAKAEPFIGGFGIHGTYLFSSFHQVTDGFRIYRTSNLTAETLKVTGLPASADANDRIGPVLSYGGYALVALWDDSAGLILVYKSTDNGDNWASVCSIPSDAPATGFCVWAGVPWIGTQEGAWLIPAAVVVAGTGEASLMIPLFADSHNCKDICVWNGRLIVPKGSYGGCLSCYVSGGYIYVTEVGLERDHGLIAEAQGGITSLFPSNEGLLFASVGGEISDTYARVWAFNGASWHFISKHTTANKSAVDIYVSANDDSLARLHISLIGPTAAYDTEQRYLEYIYDNPRQNSSMKFEASGFIVAPENDFGLPTVDAGYHLLQVVADDLTTTEKITATYGLDGAAPTTAMTDGTGIFNNTNSDCYFGANNEGVEGKRIQLKFTLARGDTNTNRPLMLSAELSYLKMPTIKNDFYFLVDLGEAGSSAASTAAQITTLETAQAKRTKSTFEYEGLTATRVLVEDMGFTEGLPKELAELNRDFKDTTCSVKVTEFV